MNTETQVNPVQAIITNQNARFLELAKQKEALVEQLKAVNEELEKVMGEVGMNNMLQDPETKIVYQVVKPKGTFMYYKEIDYIRTRKSVDEKGELSMSAAEAAGYDLGDLGPVKKAKKA